MSVTIGRLRADTVLDYCFVALSHNTIRGAAGAAILNAELLIAARRSVRAGWRASPQQRQSADQKLNGRNRRIEFIKL